MAQTPGDAHARALSIVLAEGRFVGLYEVLEYLEAIHGRGFGVAGSRPLVRVRASTSLAFPSGEIERLVAVGTKVEVIAAFLGLYGASSPLPPSYVEHFSRISGERRGQRVQAFLDIFHQRGFELLHRAHRRFRVTTHERPDPLLSRLQAFVGAVAGTGGPLASPALARSLAIKNRTAQGLERVIAQRIQRPVSVVQLEPRKARVPEDQRSILGGAGAKAGRNTLGSSLLLGAHVIDRSGLSIHLECNDSEELVAFAPGGNMHTQVSRIVEAFIRAPIAPRLVLNTHPSNLPRWRLARNHLGRDTWLGSVKSRGEVSFRLQLGGATQRK